MKTNRFNFRGLRKDGKGWAYGDLIHGVGHKEGRLYILPVTVNMETPNIDGHEIDPKTVGQSTGLTDKSGVEIFEGDLLKRIEGFYTVVFSESKCGFVKVSSSGHEISLTDVESEIIGNIYENPELLEESNGS